MASKRPLLICVLVLGIAMVGVAGSALMLSGTPGLATAVQRADPLASRSPEGARGGIVRIEGIGNKASRCNGSASAGSLRQLMCRTGAPMKRRGNIVFALPPG